MMLEVEIFKFVLHCCPLPLGVSTVEDDQDDEVYHGVDSRK